MVRDGATGPVAAYKALLRELVDRRPSGTRQKIAAAIGKHKSFVSQITNPGYPMPVPARHLGTIFDLCHFSPEERRQFMDAYERAHPGRDLPATDQGEDSTRICVSVPVLDNPQRQLELEQAIHSFAAQIGALARRWEEPVSPPSTRTNKGRS